jgi:MscS family membrane protein
MAWRCPTASITKRQWMMWWIFLLAISFFASGAIAQSIPGLKNAASSPAPTAQSPATPSPPPTPPDPLGRTSPHGCVVGFLLAAQKQDYARAAQYLDVKKPPEQAEELARQLQAVLDTGLTGNLDGLSREAEGDQTDNLRATRNLVGTVKTDEGSLDIVVERVQRRAEPPIWLFSSDTLAGVPRLSNGLSGTGLEKKLPGWMVRTKLFSVPLWRWLLLVVSMVVILVIAGLLSRLLHWLLGHALGKMLPVSGEKVIRKIRLPIFLLLLAAMMHFFSQYSLTVLARQFWNGTAVVLLVLGIAWLFIRVSDLVAVYVTQGQTSSMAVARATFVGVAVRIFKIAAVLFACVVLMSRAGVNVSALLAGLGIGGIALALAAQKTLENFFGGITIVGQRAIRVGDLCKIGDDMGTVEDIGLSSLKLRTFDRCLVSLPNSKVAQLSIQNFSLRDKFWVHEIFNLGYNTTAEQVAAVQAGVDRLLQDTKEVEKESARVRLINLSVSGLQLEIWAYLLLPPMDGNRCIEAQEKILLGVLKVLSETGTGLAIPGQATGGQLTQS